MNELAGWLATALIGVSLGLIGGGGSVLTVPVLVYLFGVRPAVATGESLFIVGMTSLVGVMANLPKGLVDFRTALLFAPPAFAGAYASRRFLVPALPESLGKVGGWDLTRDRVLLLFFALLMLGAGIAMIRNGSSKIETPRQGHRALLPIFAEGLVVGLLTGMVGAGGGFLVIPALVLFGGLPMKRAVATSLLIIAAKSLIGFYGEIQAVGPPNWEFLGRVTTLAITGILVGSWLAKKISAERLKPVFGWFVLLMGGFMLARETIL